MGLLIFQIRRVDIRYRAVAIPLEIGDTRIFRHQIVYHTIYIILDFRISQIQNHLISKVILVTIRQMDHPVLMLLIQLAFRVYHFRFDPQTELNASVRRFLHQLSDTVRQLGNGFFPVSQSLMVTAAGILIGKPAIVKQEHINS